MSASNYQLRGHMVQRRTFENIAIEAVKQFSILTEKTIEVNMEKWIDILALQDISVHILTDKKWNKQHTSFKKGESIPTQNKITIPQSCLDNSKKGDTEAFKTFFHELAHVTLKHDPIYLKADDNYEVSIFDDAEEQADLFAEIMLKLYRIENRPVQLRLAL